MIAEGGVGCRLSEQSKDLRGKKVLATVIDFHKLRASPKQADQNARMQISRGICLRVEPAYSMYGYQAVSPFNMGRRPLNEISGRPCEVRPKMTQHARKGKWSWVQCRCITSHYPRPAETARPDTASSWQPTKPYGAPASMPPSLLAPPVPIVG